MSVRSAITAVSIVFVSLACGSVAGPKVMIGEDIEFSLARA